MSTTASVHFSQSASARYAVVVTGIPAGMNWRVTSKRIAEGQEGTH